MVHKRSFAPPKYLQRNVSDRRAFGRETGQHAPRRIVEDLIDYVSKLKIEVMLRNDMVDQIVSTILRTAHAGNRGDGKIFAYDIEMAARIKTFQVGEDAI